MKIAVSGKGGVGKTTFCALLIWGLSEKGYKVVAVDADPDSNLAGALGIDPLLVLQAKSLTEMDELIEERTGVKPGERGGFFKLNPHVADIPDRYGLKIDGIRALTLGKCKKGGGGCYCAENVIVRRLIDHLLLSSEEALVIDMEAGIEHLSRGTASSVGALITVVEPGMRSIETALKVKALARDLGIPKHLVVANKVRNEEEKGFIEKNLKNYEIVGFLPFDDRLITADREGRSPYKESPEVMARMNEILAKLIRLFAQEN
jgi:CO dehydrogenase maturation factor